MWLSGLRTQLETMRMQVQSLASPDGLKDPVLLWLWCSPAAVAPIRPLAWELCHGCSPKQQKIHQIKSNQSLDMYLFKKPEFLYLSNSRTLFMASDAW